MALELPAIPGHEGGATDSFDYDVITAGVGSSSTFQLTRTATTYDCDGSAAVRHLSASSPVRATPDRIGLFTRSASAHFAWAMIVGSPL